MAQGKKWTSEEERLAAVRETNRRYRERNKDKARQRYEAKKPEILVQKREYYEDNRATLLAKASIYRQKNADKIKQWRSDPKVRAQLIAYNLRYRQEHTAPPLAEVWPYGATGWPIDLVNETVPLSIPEQIRPDVCQELCLMLFAGALQPDEVAGAIRHVVKRAWGEWAVSLDWRREDGFSFADQLVQEELWI